MVSELGPEINKYIVMCNRSLESRVEENGIFPLYIFNRCMYVILLRLSTKSQNYKKQKKTKTKKQKTEPKIICQIF